MSAYISMASCPGLSGTKTTKCGIWYRLGALQEEGVKNEIKKLWRLLDA